MLNFLTILSVLVLLANSTKLRKLLWFIFFKYNSNVNLILADYITPCKSNDPLINECATINANKALPNIVKGIIVKYQNHGNCISYIIDLRLRILGDKEFRIPNMIPLKLTKVNINPSENFKLLLNNVTVSGLETGNVLMK